MQVAVTGASGHIGANLVRTLLERGRRVRVLIHRDRRAIEGLDVDIVQGSIHDPQTVADFTKGTDVVYHLAAQISVEGAMGGLVSQTNTEGTRNIVNACISHEVKKLVHFSSIHALQDQSSSQAKTITEGVKTL